MKLSVLTLAAGMVAMTSAHATWQQLWVGSTDMDSTCVRKPASNNPVTSVSSNDIRCNAGTTAPTSTCSVAAGSKVSVEMHQQWGDRSCANEAIGGAHHGPVIVYMSKVTDALTADGSTKWFKIFESGLVDATAGKWGNDVLNDNCGKQEVTIPASIASGDYLLRAETIALHSAGSSGGAQFYMSCYALKVTGGGSASPSGVSFPGAYSASDPGILINIYYPVVTSYTVPGPAVYTG
ncbi:glycoside hydrolase family 61 protein [Geopyxis carbonaria]|nr:glycoside hydrolase family 61 protein [Geopyxis carbonaria]